MSEASTGPADRYAEAFWWVVPIPAALVAGVVMVARRPSVIGIVALTLLALIGLGLETVVARHFRRRWAGETATHPMDIPAPLREPVTLTLLCGALAGALIWKSVGLGHGWLPGALTAAGYLGFMGVAAGVGRLYRR